VQARDAIGRSWQMSTIQLDFNLPERFELEYQAADGTRQRPVMIHRALFGSIERFFGVLVEHYAGAFPPWLAPVQVRVLPVADTHRAAVDEIVAELSQAGLRADADERDETLSKRIRDAELAKIPYVVVWGDRESREAMAVRARGGEGVSTMSFDGLVADIAEQTPS